MIYTINAIESLNSVIRKATKQRKVFTQKALQALLNRVVRFCLTRSNSFLSSGFC
ncbi:hypothetical protein Neut_1716 [Nitrosomonas eutropha C91]|uniref:Transposase n=1 Tax=Nitrosomonas eutropha (strain DSM 101675 / C91 / Nm57) TaxID=335283 RepID=Q0AFC7_NITEC|nr:hypothetical protein Neut_1716 [Nitrosomonas eutropha C91]